MIGVTRGALLSSLLMLGSATAASAWVTRVGCDLSAFYDAALDGAGDLLVGYRTSDTSICGEPGAPTVSATFLRKVSGADGSRLWGLTLDGRAVALAVDGEGDVVAVTTDAVKLDGVTGDEIWRVPRPLDDVAAVATDAMDDVVVDSSGTVVVGGRTGPGFTVAWLSGSTGLDFRRHTRSDLRARGVETATDVQIDERGSVFASGAPGELLVVKIATAVGVEGWEHTPGPTEGEGSDGAAALAMHPSGDVVAGGTHGGAFTAVRLREQDGSAVWWQELAPGAAWTIAVDAAGDVVVGGAAREPDAQSAPYRPVITGIVKLSGGDGRVLWGQRQSRPLQSRRWSRIAYREVLLDAEGAALAVGDLPGGFGHLAVKLVGCPDDAACAATSPCEPVCDPEVAECLPLFELGCDDGNACNGAERCEPDVGCVAEPLDCDDGDACTIELCDPDDGCGYEQIEPASVEGVRCRAANARAILAGSDPPCRRPCRRRLRHALRRAEGLVSRAAAARAARHCRMLLGRALRRAERLERRITRLGRRGAPASALTDETRLMLTGTSGLVGNLCGASR